MERTTLPGFVEPLRRLPLQKRKELIANNHRYYRCLAAGHYNKDCPNSRACGVEGCSSINHSRYLHESTPQHTDRVPSQLRVEAPPFRQEEHSHSETRVTDLALVNSHPREQTHSTNHTDHVSLMILPALISNGKKELKVNVMLDPCSTSSHISEAAAEELELQGQALDLTIAGTGGAEIRTRSHRVDCQ